jgi:hypothetical protein
MLVPTQRASTQDPKKFYTDWDSSDVHITAFGMKLNKEQN